MIRITGRAVVNGAQGGSGMGYVPLGELRGSPANPQCTCARPPPGINHTVSRHRINREREVTESVMKSLFKSVAEMVPHSTIISQLITCQRAASRQLTLQHSIASSSVGLYLYRSIEIIVCLLTPILLANSS